MEYAVYWYTDKRDNGVEFFYSDETTPSVLDLNYETKLRVNEERGFKMSDIRIDRIENERGCYYQSS